MTINALVRCLANRDKGATTVEYAVIIVLLLLVLIGVVLWLANPGDESSLLPSTFNSVGEKVGNFDIKNIPTE